MIPKDIETTDQWQVRWETHGGYEVVRTGTEKQVRWLHGSMADSGLFPVIEKRTITVGPWVDPEAAPVEEDADDDER